MKFEPTNGEIKPLFSMTLLLVNVPQTPKLPEGEITNELLLMREDDGCRLNERLGGRVNGESSVAVQVHTLGRPRLSPPPFQLKLPAGSKEVTGMQ